ncbi:MAG: metallophosphoesterase, partial [Pseudomonadota bacterium]
MDRLTDLIGGGSSASPARADGLVYAVGDIHGCTNLMESLLENILSDVLREQSRREDQTPPPVIFLGDVIDRGPDSAGTLEYLMAITEWPEISPVFILGNHEAMLLEFLADPVTGRRWLNHGGLETLISYGLSRLGDLGDPAERTRIARDLKVFMGPHLAFLETFVPVHRSGNLWFVHAGADPNLPMEVQPADTLIWGARDFHKIRRKDDSWIVHGHNIVEQP